MRSTTRPQRYPSSPLPPPMRCPINVWRVWKLTTRIQRIFFRFLISDMDFLFFYVLATILLRNVPIPRNFWTRWGCCTITGKQQSTCLNSWISPLSYILPLHPSIPSVCTKNKAAGVPGLGDTIPHGPGNDKTR